MMRVSQCGSQERTELFSDQIISLVRLGESSGRLVENLQVIALQEQKELSFRSKIRSAPDFRTVIKTITFLR